MVLSIVILDKKEDFIQFLDPDLCKLEETIEEGEKREDYEPSLSPTNLKTLLKISNCLRLVIRYGFPVM